MTIRQSPADPSGPQAHQLADATLNMYRLVRASVGTVQLLRGLRPDAAPAVPACPAEPGGRELDGVAGAERRMRC
ncbi:hypothetical protein F7Q99_38400 [Streptomyces kaniharaensis]|uniref:Uncharacterized protein n=1 Tax=Streptomyces kaniharaensis TaxID=212423 RepID=A0A6N7L4S5_9ACTN|nr:hypothetical protein [Streptomyces kaniharaensis]MQS17907.1 hypothetical protein [Streptomyces kaniharaensis]